LACRLDLPPTRGGYGANPGIHDAHDLAWRRHQQTFARPDYKPHSNGIADDEPILEEEAMEFGQLYRSAAVLGAGEELPPARRPDEWAGQPGTRAPHVWGTSGAARVSTLDLFQRSWVLLAEDDCWREAARQASETLGVTLEFVRVGVDFVPATPDAFREAFGVRETGASLVRPDGYIAWRSDTLPSEPLDALVEALEQVSCAARTYSIPR
jgi:putative polyketide hydroxylase